MVPADFGVMLTTVPDVDVVASPSEMAVPSREIGVSGKGLVACEATSTLTVSPTLAFTLYAGTWMRGLVVPTTSTGMDPLTVLPCSSVTLTAMEPAEPAGVVSGADTVRTVPDSDAEIVSGAEPIA